MSSLKKDKAGRQKTCSLFDPSKNLQEAVKQHGLKVSRSAFGQADQEAECQNVEAVEEISQLKVSDSKSCSTCGVQFADQTAQREHFKLDWHRFNLKESLAGRKAVTEDGFEAMLEAGEADDVSLSGSDDEEGSDADEKSDSELKRQRHPWFFFEDAQGGLMSVHKCVVDEKLERGQDADEASMLDSFRKLCGKSTTHWAIVMLGGGHFAGAIFQGQKAVAHKTFHCYTVRAKQGGSQSSKDNKSGGSHPKSAGASLRR